MILPHIIAGGGLAGVTIATHLLDKGEDFLLLESSAKLGGKVETKLTNEACFEFGPNSFTNQTDDIFHLLGLLDLTKDVLCPSPSAVNRYVLKGGKIVLLPRKPQEILTTRALSFRGRLRFMLEAFYVPPKIKEEESVADFFGRHFGRETADYFADPFVSGIFAGDAGNLSLDQSFPNMAEAELSSKSLIRYLFSQRKTSKIAMQSYEMKRGLESIFVRAMEKIGPGKIRFNERVRTVAQDGAEMLVATNAGEYRAGRVYLTSPAYASAEILKTGFPELSRLLGRINYAPVVTVHLRVSKKEKFSFGGFGMLTPSVEKRPILGVLWNSSVFPSLFPDMENHYLTVYVGGAMQRDLAFAPEDAVRKIVCEEVKKIFGLENFPDFVQMRRHSKAIPQYVLGYGKIVCGINSALSTCPLLKLAGNYLGGISMPKVASYAASLVLKA